MGYDLSGKNEKIHWNYRAWHCLLALAIKNGWNPAGTEYNYELNKQLYPENDFDNFEWDGNYTANAYQCVNKDDASNLSDALVTALATILYCPSILFNTNDNINESKTDYHLRGFADELSNDHKMKIKYITFVDFCRKGEFRIE